MTLRSKLLLTVLGLVVIALVVSDLTSTTLLRSYLLNQTDQQLRAARAPFERRVTGQTQTSITTPNQTSDSTTTTVVPVPGAPAPAPPATGNRGAFISDFFIQVRSSDGTVQNQYTPTVRENGDPIPELPQTLVVSKTGKQPFTVGSVNKKSFVYRVIVSKTPSGDTFIAAVPLHTIDNTIDQLRDIELIVSFIILIALAVAAYGIVRAELRQLDRIATTAGSIAAGDLSQRIGSANTKTEVGRLSEALNAMLSQIESSFKETQASEERLRRFAADASHELRTPLTAIRGYAELFRQGAIADQDHLARILQRIEGEAQRMGLMVEDLLLLARLDQGRPLELEQVDVAQVLSHVVGDSQVVANERSIVLNVNAPEAFVSGDAMRLHQVFSNLVGNALAHTPPDTAVTVDLKTQDDFVVVNVKDNGPGLPEDAAGRVFERFYRVDSGRSRNTGGTGLGLAIVKSIVDAHQGTVAVTSQPGDGACFTVRLPMVRSFTAVPQP